MVRIITALWVVAFHWFLIKSPGRNLKVPYDTSWLPKWLYGVSNLGWLGVDIFFILSGAVISMSALGKDATSFASARFMRIFPAYFICTLSALFCIPLAYRGYSNRIVYGHALFGLQFWTGDNSIVGVAYTLKFELTFYLLIFLAMLRFKNFQKQHLLYMAGFFLLACAIVPSISSSLAANLLCFPFGPYFIFGIALANMGTRNANEKYFLLLALTCTPFVISIIHLRVTQNQHSDLYGVVIAWVTTLALWLIAIMVKFEGSPRRLKRESSRFHASRSIAVLSLMTYPLYLLHAETGQPLISFFVKEGLSSKVSMLISLITVLLFSYVLVQFLEPSARRLLGKFFWSH